MERRDDVTGPIARALAIAGRLAGLMLGGCWATGSARPVLEGVLGLMRDDCFAKRQYEF